MGRDHIVANRGYNFSVIPESDSENMIATEEIITPQNSSIRSIFNRQVTRRDLEWVPITDPSDKDENDFLLFKNSRKISGCIIEDIFNRVVYKPNFFATSVGDVTNHFSIIEGAQNILFKYPNGLESARDMRMPPRVMVGLMNFCSRGTQYPRGTVNIDDKQVHTAGKPISMTTYLNNNGELGYLRSHGYAPLMVVLKRAILTSMGLSGKGNEGRFDCFIVNSGIPFRSLGMSHRQYKLFGGIEGTSTAFNKDHTGKQLSKLCAVFEEKFLKMWSVQDLHTSKYAFIDISPLLGDRDGDESFFGFDLDDVLDGAEREEKLKAQNRKFSDFGGKLMRIESFMYQLYMNIKSPLPANQTFYLPTIAGEFNLGGGLKGIIHINLDLPQCRSSYERVGMTLTKKILPMGGYPDQAILEEAAVKMGLPFSAFYNNINEIVSECNGNTGVSPPPSPILGMMENEIDQPVDIRKVVDDEFNDFDKLLANLKGIPKGTSGRLLLYYHIFSSMALEMGFRQRLEGISDRQLALIGHRVRSINILISDIVKLYEKEFVATEDDPNCFKKVDEHFHLLLNKMRLAFENLIFVDSLLRNTERTPLDVIVQNLAAIENVVEPSVVIRSSGMDACAAVLLALEGVYKHRSRANPNTVLYLSNIYFETANILKVNYQRLVELAPDMPINPRHLWGPLSKDIIFADFYPNNALADHDNVQVTFEQLIPGPAMEAIMKRETPITLVIDTSTTLFFDPKVKATVEYLSPAIDAGKLRLVLTTSFAKMVGAGIDHFPGGAVIVYENLDLNVRLGRVLEAMNSPALVSERAQSFFSMILKNPHYLLLYNHTINQSTTHLYKLLVKDLQPNDDFNVFVSGLGVSRRSHDKSPMIFLDILYPKLFQLDTNVTKKRFFAQFLVKYFYHKAQCAGLDLQRLQSFGFPSASISACDTALRITVGLESMAQRIRYADFIKEIGKELLELSLRVNQEINPNSRQEYEFLYRMEKTKDKSLAEFCAKQEPLVNFFF